MKYIFTVSGHREAAQRFERLSDRLSNLRPFFDRAADVILEDNRKTWARSTWAPLDPDTIRRKAREGHSSKPLHESGTLRRALTVRGAPGQKLDIDRDKLTFGLDRNGPAYYGRFHQSGQGNPIRKVMTVSGSLRRNLREELLDYLLERM